MTMPAFPQVGYPRAGHPEDPPWTTWAQAVHDAATEVVEGRLTEAAQRAASVAAVQDAIDDGDIPLGGGRVDYVIDGSGQLEDPDKVYVVLAPDPSIHRTDFSEYTTGVQPADWTSRWTTTGLAVTVEARADALGGKVLRLAASTAARRLVSWNAPGAAAADVEILARVSYSNQLTDGNKVVLRARAGGAAATEVDVQGAYATLTGANGSARVGKYVAGTYTIVQEADKGPHVPANTFFWLRYRLAGTSARIRYFADIAAEPTTWDVTTTVTDVPAAGHIGVGLTAAESIDVDYFAVALNGRTAPAPS